MFLGTYNQKLDSKGRMVVPSKYRDEIGESNLVVVPWWEGNLTVFTTERFEEYMQTLNELQGSAADKRQIKRFIAANADMCRPDAQGRILLNQKLRAYAHLDGEVVITGDMESFEIWTPEMWEKESETLSDAVGMSGMLEKMKQLG